MSGTATSLFRSRTLILACGIACVTVLRPTSEASACSPPVSGWQAEFLPEGPTDGVGIAFSCFVGCVTTPTVEVAVKDEQGQLLSGSIAEHEFRTTRGWLLWKPTMALSIGSSYEISLQWSSSGEPQTYSYHVNEASPAVAFEQAPTFEASGFVELLGGEACCDEVSGSASGLCSAPTCFPDRGNARSRVRVSLWWPEAELAANQVQWSGEFFTTTDRQSIEPRLGTWLSAELAPADANDDYCYKVTGRVLVTGDVLTFEGCKPASEVALPDAEVERKQATLDGAASCARPRAKYEAAWCEGFADELAANRCETSDKSTCERALAVCRPHGESSASDSSSCAVPRRPTHSAPSWALGIVVAACGAFRRLRRRAFGRRRS
jgi:hypothetical protein